MKGEISSLNYSRPKWRVQETLPLIFRREEYGEHYPEVLVMCPSSEGWGLRHTVVDAPMQGKSVCVCVYVCMCVCVCVCFFPGAAASGGANLAKCTFFRIKPPSPDPPNKLEIYQNKLVQNHSRNDRSGIPSGMAVVPRRMDQYLKKVFVCNCSFVFL